MFVNTPFNYTGSKYLLLEQIIPNLDYTKNYFIDIFCGGGSVYTNILDKYEKVLINDIISDLIDIHKELINNSDIFINKVKKYSNTKEDQELYNNLRNSYNNEKDIDSSAKLYALMLSCTNNMLRFNKQGIFNQTWGKRGFNDSTQKKIDVYVEHVSKYKNKLYYSSKNFYDITPKKPSMIYIDPPYTNSEAGYNSFWSIELEKKLYDYIKKLDVDNHSFMLSGLLGEHKNGKRSKLIDDLIYDGYNYKILDYDYEKVSRNKNSKNSNEIIIMNY